MRKSRDELLKFYDKMCWIRAGRMGSPPSNTAVDNQKRFTVRQTKICTLNPSYDGGGPRFWSENNFGNARELEHIPIDNQWSEGYAFNIVDGELLQPNATTDMEFRRKFVAPGKNPKKIYEGKRQPTLAMILVTGSELQGGTFRQQRTGRTVDDVSPEFTIYPDPGITGITELSDKEMQKLRDRRVLKKVGFVCYICNAPTKKTDPVCRNCKESGPVIEFGTGDQWCRMCGGKFSKDEEECSLCDVWEIELDGTEDAPRMAGDGYDTRFGRTSQVGALGGFFTISMSDIIRDLRALSNDDVEILEIIPPRLGGSNTAPGNALEVAKNWFLERFGVGAWSVWDNVFNKRGAAEKSFYGFAHFSVACFIISNPSDGKFDNALLMKIHRTLLMGDRWSPKDVLIVIEILRMYRFEHDAEFEWTSL